MVLSGNIHFGGNMFQKTKLYATFTLVTLGLAMLDTTAVSAAELKPETWTDTAQTYQVGTEFPTESVPDGYIAEAENRSDLDTTDFSVTDTQTGLSILISPGQTQPYFTQETLLGAQTIFQVTDPTDLSFEFSLSLPGSDSLGIHRTESGSYLLSSNGVAVGAIATPWAFDALGHPVRTQINVERDILTQIVEPTAETVFPVTADPSLLTVVGCISTVGFATAAAIASGGSLSAGDAVAIALCSAAIASDCSTVATNRESLSKVTLQLAAVQRDTARLQAANAELTRMLNDPKSSASAKTYARNQIATNNAVISANARSIAAYQAQIADLNARISDLTYWPC